MLNGARKNLSNLVLNCVTYLWDTTLEVFSQSLLMYYRQGTEIGLNHPAVIQSQYPISHLHR
jgi:hypothetical protein